MRIVLRNTLTNELVVELFNMVEENLADEEVDEMIRNAQGLDEDIEELLQDENYFISYEESE